MATFRDADGDEWTIRITAGHLLDLKDRHGIDLRDALKVDEKDNSLVAVLEDLEKFGQVMWFFCEQQAEKRKLDAKAFAYRFDGEATERAALALWQAVLSFSQPRTAARAEAAFRAGLERTAATMGRAWDAAAQSLTSGSGAARSGAGSESTAAPTASAN